MALVTEGTERTFFYEKPREGLVRAGAQRGSVLFEGRVTGNEYVGTAYIFRGKCGRFPYHVSGHDGGTLPARFQTSMRLVARYEVLTMTGFFFSTNL